MRAVAWTGAGLALTVALTAGADELRASDPRWELSGQGTAVETVDGREAIAIETGVASRRDVRLQDGLIEFDLKLTGRRSFAYVMFRMAADGENEEVYLRPHKSGLPDALQYAPVYQGQGAWQLHHGPGGTAALEIPRDTWLRVRLAVHGRRAALYVGDGQAPALVARLFREPREGFVALRCFSPTPGAGANARFANVRVLPGAGPELVPSMPEPAPADAGTVRSWALSRALDPPGAGLPAVPTAAALGALRRVETEPDGLLELHRHVAMRAAARETHAAARIVVRAASAGLRAFELGFSDRATVFLKGRALFTGEGAYSFDRPRREGLIGYDQARLYLPLEAGDNELVVLLSDSFGGMGLMGRFPDPSGLTLEAR